MQYSKIGDSSTCVTSLMPIAISGEIMLNATANGFKLIQKYDKYSVFSPTSFTKLTAKKRAVKPAKKIVTPYVEIIETIVFFVTVENNIPKLPTVNNETKTTPIINEITTK